MTYRIEKLCETTEEARTFVQAGELRMAVIEMLEELRRTCKHGQHGQHDEKTQAALEDLRTKFYEILGDFIL